MSIKKITAKEWIKMGLPSATMTIYVGPYFEWDKKNQKLKKPKLTVTREVKKNLGEIKCSILNII